MESTISRAEHEEFRRRLEEENRRQDKRIELLEDNMRELNQLTASVGKLATSIESMVKEQESRAGGWKRSRSVTARCGARSWPTARRRSSAFSSAMSRGSLA